MSVITFKYTLDIIKSSVHKYLRRNNKDMFIRCMLEFWRMCYKKGDFEPLINRIRIMCAEEILFTNYQAIVKIDEKLKEFSVLTTSGETFTKDRENVENSYTLIIDICLLLIKSRRTRLTKYILGYYGLGID